MDHVRKMKYERNQCCYQQMMRDRESAADRVQVEAFGSGNWVAHPDMLMNCCHRVVTCIGMCLREGAMAKCFRKCYDRNSIPSL